MKIDNLPNSYIVPKHLDIGTNKLENVTALIEFYGYIPILIGEGSIPRVWLNIPTNKEGTEWYPLVKDNFSTSKKVTISKNDSNIIITVPEGIILDCHRKDNGEIIVNTLNLKPFGLDIEASKSKLLIMNNTYIGNTFVNLKVMIGIDPQKIIEKNNNK